MKLPLFHSPRLAILLEFLLYAALTAFALHASWLTWPDAYIDFSRELCLPWRVSCGDVLYRGLPCFFGPLSIYAAAALFSLPGSPSIHPFFAIGFSFWEAFLPFFILSRRPELAESGSEGAGEYNRRQPQFP